MGTTYYTNDPLGNLTYIAYPASPSVSFQYDPLNRVTSMVDAVGTTVVHIYHWQPAPD
jgi:uncharacterized protein RhaS with RHS repeats